MNYDIIGDVHGHADKLESLLRKLGYQHRSGAWRKAGHTAVFVGDLIDSGPGQLRTLALVRAMVDQQCGLVTMGNHEFNAIAYATKDPHSSDGSYLRVQNDSNFEQHKAFLSEFGLGSAGHTEWIDWFRTMPLWLELDGLRIVHACWHDPSIEVIRKSLGGGNQINDEFLVNAQKLNGQKRCPAVYDALETLLKGLEVKLPEGCPFVIGMERCVTPPGCNGGLMARLISGMWRLGQLRTAVNFKARALKRETFPATRMTIRSSSGTTG
jgi:hypothetical protein